MHDPRCRSSFYSGRGRVAYRDVYDYAHLVAHNHSTSDHYINANIYPDGKQNAASDRYCNAKPDTTTHTHCPPDINLDSNCVPPISNTQYLTTSNRRRPALWRGGRI